MRKTIRQALQLGVFGLFLTCAACRNDSAEAPIAAEPESASEAAATVGGDGLTEQVAAALADVADRTGIATDAITVTQASIVNWSDGAVGCPEEGKAYTQAIVPGILILLEAGGEAHRYHGRAAGDVFHCPNDRAQAPAFGSGKEFM